MKRLLALVLTMGIAFSLLAGCTQNANNGDENGGNTGNKEWKIGLIAAGTFGDNGLNDALKKAAETFTENTGIPVTCVEVNEFNDHEIHARNFGNEGYDMVIMGGTVSEIMSPILEDYPDTHFVLNKGTVDGYDNCTSIQFEEPAAGFIGGAFAVMMSEYLGGPSEVGWIGGQRIADLELCRYCFEAGAAYAGGKATAAYVGDFTDIAKAKDTCPIRNNSYYITSPGKGKGQIFILLDFQTWCGNTWCIHGSQIMGIFHIGIQSGFDNLMFCMSQFKGFFFKLVGIHIFLLKNKNYSSNAGRFLP